MEHAIAGILMLVMGFFLGYHVNETLWLDKVKELPTKEDIARLKRALERR